MIAYQGGNIAAFNELYRRFKPRLNDWIRARVQNSHDREDIIHDTFLNLIRFANTYSPSHKFITWFYTIAKNQVIEYWKSKKRNVSINKYDDSTSHRDLEIADDRNVEREVQGRHIYNTVRFYVENHGGNFARFVGLRDLEGFSYEEISQITGLPIGTIKSRISRGRKELRWLLS